MITVLSGGVGAARLLRILRQYVDPSTLRAIVNVGDDLQLHGLTICPDLDTNMYTLAGLNNDELGWGLKDESWRVMQELGALGGESWFGLGDRDLATHLYRSQRLSEGATKLEVTRELCSVLGVDVQLLPVTNDVVATTLDTAIGRLSFQDYFVRHHHDVEVTAISYEGADQATPSPGVLESLEQASRIIIAPSNPLLSVEPLLRVRGVRDVLKQRRNDVVAVSPIIGGRALKGPADRLMREMHRESSCVGIARNYQDLVGTLVIDDLDAQRASEIVALGMDVTVTTTIMDNSDNDQRLAHAVLP